MRTMQPFTTPPAPPPPGFSPEDTSLYRQPGLHSPNVPNVASPGVIRGRTSTAEEVLRAILPLSKEPETGDTLLLKLCQALAKKQMLVDLLADVQLDCEELESEVAEELGEYAAKKALTTVYDPGNTGSAKGRLMLAISNVTYKSVEILDR